MFEHFGLKDVFVAIAKFKKQIICGILALTILAMGYGIISYDNTKANTYTASETWYFNDIDWSGDQTLYLNPVELYGEHVSSNIFDLVKLDTSTTKIAKLTSEKIGMDVSAAEVKNAMSVSLGDDKCMLTITCATDDKKLTEGMLESYNDYFVDLYTTLYHTTDADGVHSLGITDVTVTSNSLMDNLKKMCICGLALGIVFSFIIVFFIAMFKPTVNRRNDLCVYEKDVIGEALKRTENYYKIIQNNISYVCHKNNWKKVGLIDNEKSNKTLIHRIEKIEDTEVVLIKKINESAESQEIASQCDAVFITVKYSYTHYSDIEKQLDILKSRDIKFAGFVAFK